jgi:hypothetical protein
VTLAVRVADERPPLIVSLPPAAVVTIVVRVVSVVMHCFVPLMGAVGSVTVHVVGAVEVQTSVPPIPVEVAAPEPEVMAMLPPEIVLAAT